MNQFAKLCEPKKKKKKKICLLKMKHINLSSKFVENLIGFSVLSLANNYRIDPMWRAGVNNKRPACWIFWKYIPNYTRFLLGANYTCMRTLNIIFGINIKVHLLKVEQMGEMLCSILKIRHVNNNIRCDRIAFISTNGFNAVMCTTV